MEYWLNASERAMKRSYYCAPWQFQRRLPLKHFVRGEQLHRSAAVFLRIYVSVRARLSHWVYTVRRDWTRNAKVRAAARPLFGLTVKRTRNMSDVPMQDVRNRKVAGFAFWSKSGETLTLSFLLVPRSSVSQQVRSSCCLFQCNREEVANKNVSH